MTRRLIPQPTADTPLVITYLEAARLLGGVSTRHIQRLVNSRELRAVGQGRARRISYQSVLDYVAREEAS